ncbi:lantibiotic dehydratase, partial [Streptomyces palmae]
MPGIGADDGWRPRPRRSDPHAGGAGRRAGYRKVRREVHRPVLPSGVPVHFAGPVTFRMFAARSPVLLRLAVLPVDALADRAPGPEAEPADSLRALAADPFLREAVELSSDSLAGMLRRIEDGADLPPKRLARVAESLTKYALRITGRPTPFGLFAGVAAAELGPRAQVGTGAAHRKFVRPDAGWAASVSEAYLGEAEPTDRVRVVSNDLCFVRGDSLHSPWVPAVGGAAGVRAFSVRYGPAVRFVYERAARPVGLRGLVAMLAEQPDLVRSAESAERIVRRLLRMRFLLSSLAPEALGGARRPAPDGPEADPLPGEARAALERYARTPVGGGRRELAAADRALRTRHGFPCPPLQVDLRMDASVTVPEAVGAELAEAAAVLWQLTPREGLFPHLDAYTRAFVERYGTGRAVPVGELLDPHAGLGLPAGYRTGAPRPAGAGVDRRRAARDALLAELVHGSLAGGGEEIVLDQAAVLRLAGGRAEDRSAPESLELCAQVLAAGLEELDRGDFRLVLARHGGSEAAGTSAGRFAHLLGTERIRALMAPDGDDSRLHAQVCYQPASPRHLNIGQVPRVLPYLLPVGVFADRTDRQVIDWRELDVLADDEDRLRLVRRTDGREVVVRKPHLLGADRSAPPLVRFLLEISAGGSSVWAPWSWGALEAMPFLPRVRYGRVVLRLARWKLSAPLLREDLPPEEWRAELARWRARLGVPRRVQSAAADETLSLDLDDPLHQRLLRQESRNREVEICEDPAAYPAAYGWIGGLAHELTLSLVRRHRPPAPAPP